jgi:exocyst complex component 4
MVLNLTTSQDRLRKLRDTLATTRGTITKKGGDLSIALNRSQQYKEMLRLLETMERLQAVPDKIEHLITEKQFLKAVNILSEALRVLAEPEFAGIGALQDVGAYLKTQEASLQDLLVEELHNHLYLKSPYCLERWAPYERGQRQRTSLPSKP